MTRFFGVAGQIAEAIGEDQALRLLQARGGTRILVPSKPGGSQLADIIGEQDTWRMIKAFRPGRLDLPMGPGRGIAARREDAKHRLRLGASVREVALACDLSERTVRLYKSQIADDTQLPLPFDD